MTSLQKILDLAVAGWVGGNRVERAGTELCQAQYKLELAKFWFGSAASLKFDWLIQTEVVAIVNNQILSLDKCGCGWTNVPRRDVA